MKNKFYIILSSIIIFCSCHNNNSSNGNPGYSQPATPVPETPAAKADLVVSNVEIIPSQPTAGTPFLLNVYVSNNGNMKSSEFDFTIHYERQGNTSEWFGGANGHDRGQDPGETVKVYSGNNFVLNEGGSYVFVVTLKLADGTLINKRWEFNGLAKK